MLTPTDRVYAEVQAEDDVILLVNEALGLRAVGPDLAAAARDFADEFAYSFQRFNLLDKEQLSPKAQAIKQLLNQLVDHGSH